MIAIARKPKFRGKLSKWEKRRIVRGFARQAAGKEFLAKPLTIAPAAERNSALREGKMFFYDGTKRVTVKLFFPNKNFPLQGVYKTADDSIITLRAVKNGQDVLVGKIFPFGESIGHGWFSKAPDLAHMELSPSIIGEGIGLKGVSKAERHQRGTKRGEHSFSLVPRFTLKFKRLFEKLGYSDKGNGLMEKKGKFQPKDDLENWHRIEAIDPKTGKARVFSFQIRRK